MWGKLLTVLVVGAIIGAVTFLGQRALQMALDARYAAGVSDERVRSEEKLRAADVKAATAGQGYLEQQIASGDKNREELARISALALTFDRSNRAYAQTADGAAACLPSERVQLLEADRAAYFPSPAPAAPGGPGPRSMPADAPAQGH